MKINSISFGKKIPIAKCKIIDKHANKTTDATIFELDGKDSQDVAYFNKLPQKWEFKPDLVGDMELKFIYPNSFQHLHFYSVENKKGEVIGIAETSDEKKYSQTNLDFIETNHDDYKYIGIDLMAFIAQGILKKGYKKFRIPDPYETARMFYVEHCGFEDIEGKHDLEMNKEKITELTHKPKEPIKF